LLADRAAAAHLAPTGVVLARLLDRLEVEAVVVGEVLVLRGDQGDRNARRHLVEIAPVVRDPLRPVARRPRL
jgi:hypothetical protein